MKVFILGNISDKKGLDKAEIYLRKKGHIPINPEKIIQALPEEITNADFTVIAFEMVRICEAVYLVDGYERDMISKMLFTQAERTEKIILQ